MKVLYVDHTARASGGEIALARLLAALGDGIEPIVVLGEDGPLVAELRDAGIEVLVAQLPGATRDLRKERLANPLVALARVVSVVRYAFTLRRLIRAREVDLVHTNSLKAGFYGCLAARLARVPSIWHLRDRLARDYLPLAAVVTARVAAAVLPTVVVCNSRATLATLPRPLFELLGRRAALAAPIADPIDVDGVHPAVRPAEPECFRIAMVGRFSPWKGQVVALRAFAAADLGPKARLVLMGAAMFGEEEYEREIHREIDALGLAERVELPGFVDDVLGALADVDVVVHASTIPEPFGQVVLEGLAAGVPVIATRQGGPGEILTDRMDGLLYPAGDAAALGRLLRELRADPQLRRRLAENGRKRVADFSPAVISAAVVQLYVDITAARRKGERSP